LTYRVHTPKEAKIRCMLSLICGATCIIIALLYALSLEWETKQRVIGGEAVTSLGMREGAIVIGLLSVGITIIGFTPMFYWTWKNEWSKVHQSGKGGSH